MTTIDNPHYITPEEAEKKCCLLKYSDCIGPQCMAWRWKEIADWKEGSDLLVTYSETHGYCGMVRT